MTSGSKSSLARPVADRIRHGGDVDRVVVVGRRDPHGRLPAHVHQGPERLVAGGRRGGGGVLRVERHQQDAVAALVEQRLDPAGHLRLAVAHRPVDHHRIAHRRLEPLGLAAGDGLERALVQRVVPHAGVVAALRPRALRQDDQVEERPPDQPRHLDHPPVRQELLEIPAHGPVGRALRRSRGSSAARRRGPRRPSGGRPAGCRLRVRAVRGAGHPPARRVRRVRSWQRSGAARRDPSCGFRYPAAGARAWTWTGG